MIQAAVVDSTVPATSRGFVTRRIADEAEVYTDDHRAYMDLENY